MNYKRLLQCLFVFVVLAVLHSQRSVIRAQNWYDSCTAGIYCNGPCNTVWDPPGNVNNCSCEAQGCNNNYTFCRGTSGQADYETCCGQQFGYLDNTYPPPLCNLGSCLSGCYKCGGTGIIQGTCPSYYNPCINVCAGTSPTPTPTPAPPPVPVLCGLGGCNAGAGETCSNCPVDCGACPTPIPICGNGSCESAENCANCSADCGTCSLCDPTVWGTWDATCLSCDGPVSRSRTNQCGSTQTLPCLPYNNSTIYGPFGSCSGSPATKTHTNECGTPETVSCTGTIQARAVVVTSSAATCDNTRDSTTGVSPVAVQQFSSYPAQTPVPGAKLQTGADYVSFADIVGGTYTINPIVPAGYVRANACFTRTLNTPLIGEGVGPLNLSVGLDNDTLIWDLGYTLGTPWVQTGEGNVYAEGSITSAIADLSSPRVFSLNGTGGYPGVVRYGADYDFDPDTGSSGETRVSSTKWLAQETDTPMVNYYDYFRIKLGGTFPAASFPNLLAVDKPDSSTTPYFVSGDMTTSGNWTILDGETLIVIVDGNLTLGGKVNLTGSGFAAFIVNGDITVVPAVGGIYTSDVPVIEGIYVTSPTGRFITSLGSLGAERFVGQGMFVAGGFLLQRDLDSVDANTTTSSELFLYNPRLLFSMPDSMRDVPITWEEVAP